MIKTRGMAMLLLGMSFTMVGCDSEKPTASKPGGAGAEQMTLDLGNRVTIKLVQIPAGNFLMGSPETEKYHTRIETPHEVTISKPFYMGAHEVTQAQWQAVMGTNPSRFKGDNRPVEQVSWGDCQSFCKKLSAKVGRTIRLPTEAEWEYACRAATKTAYYFGADVSQLAQHAWYKDNSGLQYDWVRGTSDDVGTHDVGGKIPNAWGLYDMHGNVWEWCQDWYGVYSADSQTDPAGPSSGMDHVARGGSWHDFADVCRDANRGLGEPGRRNRTVGFRLALDSE